VFFSPEKIAFLEEETINNNTNNNLEKLLVFEHLTEIFRFVSTKFTLFKISLVFSLWTLSYCNKDSRIIIVLSITHLFLLKFSNIFFSKIVIIILFNLLKIGSFQRNY